METIEEYIERCHLLLPGSAADAYLKQRGGTYNIAKFKLGTGLSGPLWDKLEGRLLMPSFHPWHGELVGVTGRQLDTNDVQKKYINTINFPKKRMVYGVPRTETVPFVVVVEGQFDAISMETFGIPCYCVYGSSAPTVWQAALLRRITDNVILWPDLDKWNEISSWRKSFERCGFHTIKYGAFTKNHTDPDEMAQHALDDVKAILCKLNAWNW